MRFLAPWCHKVEGNPRSEEKPVSNLRKHYVTTSDGVTIGGTVHGRGPALVFLQGVIGDGDLDWARVAGELADDFTCHLPSMRGRGLSGDHADLSISRHIDDAIAYVDSLGEPVGLTGLSGGGAWSLVAAARSDTVSALAPFEPGVLSVADEGELASLRTAVGRTMELVSAGDLTAASRAFAGFPFTDAEIVAAEDLGYFEDAGPYAPHLLNVLGQAMVSEDPTGDPSVLGAIRCPTTVLIGSETSSLFRRGAQYVVGHVPGAQVEEIAGAAHAAPLTHPGPLAAALAGFFSTALQPA